MSLRVPKAKQSKAEQSRRNEAHEAGPPATMQSTRIASAHRTSCRRCGCVASRCVATQRHSLSRLTEPLWVASAPQVRAGTQHCAGSFRYLTPKKGKAGSQVSNKPFGSGGNTRRCDTRDHVISFLQTVRGDPVALCPFLETPMDQYGVHSASSQWPLCAVLGAPKFRAH